MKLLFLLFIMLISMRCHSQDFKLIKVDNQLFPTIKLTVSLNEGFDINELIVNENGERKILKIDSVNLNDAAQSICYLIDANSFNEEEMQIFYNALSNSLSKLKPKTLINICNISVNNKNTCFTPFSYEFTDKTTDFVKFVSKLSKQQITNSELVDFNCALLQTINFIYGKEYLPKKKTLIVISKNIKGKTEINRILTAGEKRGIHIKLFSNIADSLMVNNIDFYSIQSQVNEKALTNKLINASLDKNLTNIYIRNNYTLEFKSTQNRPLNILELHYHDNVVKTTYRMPDRVKKVREIWFIVIIFILVVGIIILVKKQIKLKREFLGLKETLSLLFDKKLKILSTQTTTPVIEVKLLDELSNYHVKKIVTTIGRKKDCDITVNNLTISAYHANITNEGGEFYIQDNGSTNGIFVNDIKITKKLIKNGDIIRMGMAILTIHY